MGSVVGVEAKVEVGVLTEDKRRRGRVNLRRNRKCI